MQKKGVVNTCGICDARQIEVSDIAKDFKFQNGIRLDAGSTLKSFGRST